MNNEERVPLAWTYYTIVAWMDILYYYSSMDIQFLHYDACTSMQ